MKKTKITKILIANRGEIACRVMKTARKMGVKTVAVYSDADKKALHTRMADEAVHIGASPAAESYLVIDKIIDACKQTGADAVHPGYGFLSENPEFARRLKKEGITFIGPAPESMEAMGLKDAAKKLMVAAGVPVTPGYHGEDQTPSVLQKEADAIGYPVLIKAVAGGGGKGMRKVEAADDFIAALESCQREAKSSFGDDRVLIEKYITSPRHIEVQVFGDTHGNVVHMFERDCSLQRRHQKVIEEAPAPGMTKDVRKAMTDAAVQAAKAVDYVGAGTVEFIVDGSGKLKTDGFWFMEMNTRLQVEHPVTEMITGLDLVELQIRVAQGERLPEQDEITIEGHAIEARLYAENPNMDFLPSVGIISCFDSESWTDGDDEYRIDTGVDQGDRVTIHYDPMIAKLIALAQDRENAIVNLQFLIEEAEVFGEAIDGLVTNSGFLYRCLASEVFRKGNVNTHFINNNLEKLLSNELAVRPELFAIAATFIRQKKNESLNVPTSKMDGWRLNLPSNECYVFQGEDDCITVKVLERTALFDRVRVGSNREFDISMQPENEDVSNEDALLSYRSWSCKLLDDHVSITRKGDFFKVKFPSHEAEDSVGGNAITAPMPGKIIAVNAAAGDPVKAGDALIIMEAMKMEMTLEAPRDGVVGAINCTPDDLVSDGDVLLEMAEEE